MKDWMMVVICHNDVPMLAGWQDLALFTEAKPKKRLYVYRTSFFYSAIMKVILAVVNSVGVHRGRGVKRAQGCN